MSERINFWDFKESLSSVGIVGGSAAKAKLARPAPSSSSYSSSAVGGLSKLESSHCNLNLAPSASPPRRRSGKLPPLPPLVDPPGTANPVEAFAVLVPCKCRARTCDKCGSRLGWLVRQNMLGKSHLFRKPGMLSLTVDRKHFDSPEAAHRRITEGSFIPRLMRLLGIKTWFWVLEFQTNTGTGWPHWHLLIDLADAPGGRLDLDRAWRLWRDKWQLGGLNLSAKDTTKGVEYAIMYLTKYLTKQQHAYPIGVLVAGRGTRFVQGCKAIGSLTGQPSRPKVEAEPVDQPDLPFRLPRTPYLVRMARCGMTTNVLFTEVEPLTGVVHSRKWLGTVDATPEDIVDLSEQGLLSLRCGVVDVNEKEWLVVTDNSIGGVVAALKRANEELADREVGYEVDWKERVFEREAMIALHTVAFWDRPEPRNERRAA